MKIKTDELPAYIFDFQKIAAKLENESIMDVSVKEMEGLVKLWLVEIIRELEEPQERLTKLFLSKTEVAETCSVSVATVSNWISRGLIEGHKVGHRRLFEREEIINFIKNENHE